VRRSATRRLAVVWTLTALLAAGCAAGGTTSAPPGGGAAPPDVVGDVADTAATTRTLVRSPTAPSPSPASSVPASSRSRATAAQDDPPSFHGRVTRVDAVTAARMRGSSWRPGCPVAIAELRLVHADHWGFDGVVHPGVLVVHESLAEGVLGVLRELFRLRYPVARMRLVDDYGGGDDRSMAANNTSAFNCRRVAGSTSWSEHAYGRAIDLNPIQNPYVSRSGRVSPPAGGPYADRSRRDPGVLHDGDDVVRAFARAGWRWGGLWTPSKDYQHFSTTGR
jgi:hypothetical protein